MIGGWSWLANFANNISLIINNYAKTFGATELNEYAPRNERMMSPSTKCHDNACGAFE